MIREIHGRRGAHISAVAALTLCIALAGGYAAMKLSAAPAHHAAAGETYLRAPLAFEANAGRTDARVKFLARGSGYSVFLTPTESVLELSKPGSHTATVVRSRVAGASPQARITGVGRLARHVNSFVGSRSQWRTGIPAFARVHVARVYPGIDLAYYGNQRQLEYDFTVAPGADPARIRLALSGARSIRIDGRGDAVLATGAGTLRERRPVVYQRIGEARRAVAARFVLHRGDQLGFQVGSYDHSRPLVIDPTLAYSEFLGGSGDDQADAVTVDASGAAYVAGSTASADFPTSAGAVYQTGTGGADAFVTRLNPDGSGPSYSTYLGGATARDVAKGVAVDSSGDIYVAGSTASSDFPTQNAAQGADPDPASGAFNGFVTKLDPSASGAAQLVFSTYLGGLGGDEAAGIAVGPTDDAYVTGYTASTSFPTTSGAFQTALDGGLDGFVARFSSDGARQYSTYLGGATDDQARAIAVDGSGNAYVGGTTSSPDFPTTPGVDEGTISGAPDGFVTKLNAGGTSLVYSTFLGGGSSDDVNGIAVDGAGEAYAVGETDGPFPVTQGAFDTTGGGVSDGFVAKLDAAGSARLWATYLGGSTADVASGIALDAAGNAYVAGYTGSTDFPTSQDANQATSKGSFDAFLSAFDSAGSLFYSTYLGGSLNDQASGVAAGSDGDAYIVGSTAIGASAATTTDDFPVTAGSGPYHSGTQEAFVAKFNTPAPPLDTTPPDTVMDAGPGATTSDRTATFTFHSSEAGSTFECQLDTTAFFACSSPYTTPALADGGHTFQVRATDAAGNVDSTPASAAFSVTTPSTPPPVVVTSGPTAPSPATLPSVTGTARVRQLLTCTPGSWSGSPSFSYAWLRNGHAISGASGDRYKLTASDAASAIQCQVTAVGVGGRAVTASIAVFVPALPPAVSILTRSARVRHGVIAIRVRCTGSTGSCRGKLVLTPAHGRKLRLGAASVRLAAGKTQTVRMKLTATGRKAVARARRHRLAAVARIGSVRRSLTVSERAVNRRRR